MRPTARHKTAFPFELLQNPVRGPIGDRLFERVDQFHWEILEDDDPGDLYSYVMAPPVVCDGRLLKGVLFTIGADYLNAQAASIRRYFYLVGCSRWCSIPWSGSADGLAVCYENSRRRRWFEESSPQRRQQRFISIQEADWVNDRLFRPRKREKVFDLVCVARPANFKNLPFLAEVLAQYEQRWGPIRVAWLPGVSSARFDESERDVLAAMKARVPQFERTLTIFPNLDRKAVADVLNQSKAFVMTSLIEGKNRALHEAMSCDLPVIYPEAFNRVVRGSSSIAPELAGRGLHFDVASFSSGIRFVLENPNTFSPRDAYLDGFSGRIVAVKKVLMAFGRQELIRAMTIDESEFSEYVRSTYGVSLSQFVYDDAGFPTVFVGTQGHTSGLDTYQGAIAQALDRERDKRNSC